MSLPNRDLTWGDGFHFWQGVPTVEINRRSETCGMVSWLRRSVTIMFIVLNPRSQSALLAESVPTARSFFQLFRHISPCAGLELHEPQLCMQVSLSQIALVSPSPNHGFLVCSCQLSGSSTVSWCIRVWYSSSLLSVILRPALLDVVVYSLQFMFPTNAWMDWAESMMGLLPFPCNSVFLLWFVGPPLCLTQDICQYMYSLYVRVHQAVCPGDGHLPLL